MRNMMIGSDRPRLLPAAALLRTVHASLPAHGSSLCRSHSHDPAIQGVTFGLPLRYAFGVAVPVTVLVANRFDSMHDHGMRTHQSSINSMPSFAFPHKVDSPDSLAMKDQLDVGPLSRRITNDSYPHHYHEAFAFSNLSIPHCRQH